MDKALRIAVLTDRAFSAAAGYDEEDLLSFSENKSLLSVASYRRHRSFADILNGNSNLLSLLSFSLTVSADTEVSFFVPGKNSPGSAEFFKEHFDAVFLLMTDECSACKMPLPLSYLLSSDLLPPLFIFNLCCTDVSTALSLPRNVFFKAVFVVCRDQKSKDCLTEAKLLSSAECFVGEGLCCLRPQEVFGSFSLAKKISSLYAERKDRFVFAISADHFYFNPMTGSDFLLSLLMLRILSAPQNEVCLCLNKALYSLLDRVSDQSVALNDRAGGVRLSPVLEDLIREDLKKSAGMWLSVPFAEKLLSKQEMSFFAELADSADCLVNRLRVFMSSEFLLSNEKPDFLLSTLYSDISYAAACAVPASFLICNTETGDRVSAFIEEHVEFVTAALDVCCPDMLPLLQDPNLKERLFPRIAASFKGGGCSKAADTQVCFSHSFTLQDVLKADFVPEDLFVYRSDESIEEIRQRCFDLHKRFCKHLYSIAPHAADENLSSLSRRAQRSNFTYSGRYDLQFEILRILSDKLPYLKEKKQRNALNVLCFGCSSGDEVFTLADVFPDQFIYGADISKEALRFARSVRNNRAGSEKLRFLTVEQLLKEGKTFDVITVMTVLCRHPDTVGLQDASEVYSFSEFESVFTALSALLNKGGLLCMFNANYRAEDTDLKDSYDILWPDTADSTELSAELSIALAPFATDLLLMQKPYQEIFGHTALFDSSCKALSSAATQLRYAQSGIIFIKK